MRKKKKLESPYLTVEDVNGYGVIYNNVGEYSVVFRLQNPVRKYSSDPDGYDEYNHFVENMIKTLGAGYCFQKHDIFSRVPFEAPSSNDFLQESYFEYFEGRQYTKHITYLTITQEKKKGRFQYDASMWKDFWEKVNKAKDLLSTSHFNPTILNRLEVTEFIHKYFCLNFKDKYFSLSNIYANEHYLKLDDKKVKCTSLVDIDEVDMPNDISPSFSRDINGSPYTEDLFTFLDQVPGAETIAYNQAIYIPNQKNESVRLAKKLNRHASLPSTPNAFAAKEIEAVQNIVESENKMFVYMHYSILTVGKKLDQSLNYLESAFGKRGVRLSKSNFNQLELFLASLPGCGYWANPKYDRFITLNDVAGCLQYKEVEYLDEDTPLKVYYTNRAGIPKCIDFTGKEGKNKLTTNSNFFCLGPSGSGKSFHMNSVVRQLYEQDTDIIMVDTGHSYEGLCSYLGGKYISYREEAPISMNPFQITKEEVNIEKINFLKSLIFVIWKGASGKISTVEDEFIQRTIETYYKFYFEPFDAYSDEQRERRKSVLMLEYRNKRKETNIEDERLVAKRRIKMLQEFNELKGNTEAEVESAQAKIEELKEKYEIEENETMSIILYEISKEEEELRSIQVKELNFNSFFEFALQYIPFLQEESKITFDIDEFRFLLSKFYKGGAMEKTLNENMDSSLFDEKFVVFEIDAIKDDKTLFPIVTLIIMDLFLQKMRLKKNRKALIIEEAWKAIASDLMAGYILYLYKTVRKFWGIVGVVTQEIEDIISSEVVKSAIINNSEITILLDQTKLKDRFSEVQSLLGLTNIECSKIWTINNLDNKAGRGAFKEVYIRRGLYGEVYGVEESPECYMAYTTEKVEKDALAKYRAKYGDIQIAIQQFCNDWRASGISKIMDFSKQVMDRNE